MGNGWDDEEMEWLRDEIAAMRKENARLRLTDEERDVLQSLGPALKWYPDEVAVLMNILERHR